MRFKLRGLDATATYEVRNFDVSATARVTGRELLGAGLVVRLYAKPAAATIAYRRLA
jgi:hypothetical protein